MINNTELKEGDKVHYQPNYYPKDKWENGIVKSIPELYKKAVFVVYNCAGEWDNYKNYTAARTNVLDLKKGWFEEDKDELDNNSYPDGLRGTTKNLL